MIQTERHVYIESVCVCERDREVEKDVCKAEDIDKSERSRLV